jgi:uncharacterized metal-binding protein YceD (DUF177 family)
MSPEFSRPVSVAALPRAGLAREVLAEPAERTAVANRLDVPEVLELRASFTLRPAADGTVLAEGSVTAVLMRICVITLEPFAQTTTERFLVRLVPEQDVTEAEDGLDAPDVVPFAGSTVDLGELAVEQVALAMDPYPRSPGAEPKPGDAAPNAFAALVSRPRN